MCLPACLPVCQSVCLSVCRSVGLFVCLSVCLFVNMHIVSNTCLSVCLPVCLSVHIQFVSNTYLPIKASVVNASICSPKLKLHARHGSPILNWNCSLPLVMSHNLTVCKCTGMLQTSELSEKQPQITADALHKQVQHMCTHTSTRARTCTHT